VDAHLYAQKKGLDVSIPATQQHPLPVQVAQALSMVLA